jgi:hypothetical protein
MSYHSSDNDPLCDFCNQFDYFHMVVPWPMPDEDDGRPLKDTLLICQRCLQNVILEHSRGPARQDAYRNARRWQEYQARLDAEEKAARHRYEQHMRKLREGDQVQLSQRELEACRELERDLAGEWPFRPRRPAGGPSVPR